MGAANSVRKLTIDSIALLEQLEPNAGEVQRKREVREYVQHALQQEWPSCRVLPFGSSESGIGFGGSDVDLGIYFDDMDVDHQGHFSMQERIQILTTARARLGGAFTVKEFVQNARVPVLKLWDPKRQASTAFIACDVCVGGINAILNTALIKYYGQGDPRVRPLAFAVKYWAQQRGINDSVNGTLSSYGFSLLLIFYLQSRHSPILLPSVHCVFQSLQDEKNLSVLLQRLHSIPLSDVPSTFGTSFQDSVGALLAGFFQFYASQFNVEDDVVSVRTGLPLSKTTKWSHSVPWRISIEDPFELAHDVGRVIFNRKGQELLNFEFRRAYEMVCIGHRLDEICAPDATSWNIVTRCYICEGSDHRARECMKLQQRMDHACGSQHVATATVTTAAILSDCWYCGECGHYKATCPMLSFRNIPLRPEGSAVQVEVQPQAIVRSQPIPIAQSTTTAQRTASQGVSKYQTWERGYSHPSPSRSSKKKKRPRQGSSPALSPAASPPAPPMLLVSPSLLSEKQPKRRYHHQQQQQDPHQRFPLAPATSRVCGGGRRWSGKPRKMDVVCTT